MKKIAGKIAMILVLIMLANSFISCTYFLPTIFSKSTAGAVGYTFLGLLIDLIIVGIITMFSSGGISDAPNEAVDGIYLVHAEYNPLMEYNSFTEKLNSLPEMEKNSFMKKLNFLPEEKRSSLVRIIFSLSDSEIVSSMERINALSNTKFASTVQAFTSLSEAELDLVIDKLHKRATSQPETKNVATIDYSPVNAYMVRRLQY